MAKKDKILMWDETVFRDPEVFELDYVPETFIHRDSQVQSLKYVVQPAMRGMRPLNALCLGAPATGKTTAIIKIFEEIEKHTDSVATVYINCQLNSTRYVVFSQIFQKLFGYAPPSSGVSFKKIFNEIAKHLIDKGTAMVIALDDINYLFHDNEANEVLYSLLRAHEEHPGVKLGVIGVLSDVGVAYNFDQRVNSIFLPEEIHFPLYSRKEIREILKNRTQIGFYPGVMDDDVLEMIASRVEAAGDLRVGVDALKRAGLNAEMRASKKISADDVKKAAEKSSQVHMRQAVQALSDNEKLILRLMAENKGEALRAGDLYEKFKADSKLGYTVFHEMLNKLDSIRIINTDFTGKGDRGRSRKVSLRYDAKEILKLLGR